MEASFGWKTGIAASLVGTSLAVTAMEPASASVVWSAGNQQYTNVNIAADVNQPLITGEIGNTGMFVTFGPMFLGGIQQTEHGQHGVAFVENYLDSLSGNPPSTGFDLLTLSAQGNTAWTAGDLALDLVGRTDTNVTFTAFDGVTALQLGSTAGCSSFTTTSCTLALDATGQNQYNFSTIDNELITSLVMTVPTGFKMADIKQVSLDAVVTPLPGAVALFAGGLGLIGLCGTRRKRSAAMGDRTTA